MAIKKNMTYYLTNKIRIKYDGYSYVPEIIYIKREKDEEGNEIEGVEPTVTWGRYGYYSTMKGAMSRIIELYPLMCDEEDKEKEEKTYMSIKKLLILLNNLKKDITVKVIEETGIDEKYEDNKEEENVEPKAKRRSKKTK